MYVHGFAFRLTGPFNPIALAAALADVIERHDALRTATVMVNRRRSRRMRQVGVPLDLIDLRQVEPAERWHRARAVAAATLARPFARARPPLLRATLVRLAEHDRVLAVALHHILCVDASSGVLLDEVFQVYRSLVGGDGPQVTRLHPEEFDVPDRIGGTDQRGEAPVPAGTIPGTGQGRWPASPAAALLTGPSRR
jgi:hypothetical protein